MKEKMSTTNNKGLTLLLTAFLFVRTTLMSPSYCFFMNEDYPYFSFSVESVVFTVLLLVFSALSAMLCNKFNSKYGIAASLIYLLAVSDPLFFALQDNCLKLAVNILIQLLIFSAVSEKNIVPVSVGVSVVLFISTLIVPYTAFTYAPIILSIYVLLNRKILKGNSYISGTVSGVVCTATGFLLNIIISKNVSVFANFIADFSFADESGIYKHWKLVFAFVPVVVFANVFFNLYKKAIKRVKYRKLKKVEFLMVVKNSFFIPFMISVVTVFFLYGEGAYTVNMFIPAIMITLLCCRDECCVAVVDILENFIRNHKIIASIILIVVFAVALDGVINYHSAKQLIFYIRY